MSWRRDGDFWEVPILGAPGAGTPGVGMASVRSTVSWTGRRAMECFCSPRWLERLVSVCHRLVPRSLLTGNVCLPSYFQCPFPTLAQLSLFSCFLSPQLSVTILVNASLKKQEHPQTTKAHREVVGKPTAATSTTEYQSYLILQSNNRTRNSQTVDSAVRESPAQGVFPARLEKTEEINALSERSKKLITDMGNTEIFELCETSSKTQCSRLGLILAKLALCTVHVEQVSNPRKGPSSSTRRTMTPCLFPVTSSERTSSMVLNTWSFRKATNVL